MLDYDDTFAPTARMATITTTVALTGKLKLPIYHMDVKSTFVNGDMKEEMFVEQPPRFQKPHSNGKVNRLKKALYGLKQAPCAWNKKIDAFFQHTGFTCSFADPNLYIHRLRVCSLS